MTASNDTCRPVQRVEPRTDNRTLVHPVVDVNETDDGYAMTAALPGVDESALTLSVENRTLTIDATNVVAVPEGHRPVRREFGPVRFRRVFELPDHVDPSGITASLKQGMLTVTLPKRDEVKPRRIKVKAA